MYWLLNICHFARYLFTGTGYVEFLLHKCTTVFMKFKLGFLCTVAQIKLSYYFLCIYYLNEKVFSIDVIVDDVYFVWSKIVTRQNLWVGLGVLDQHLIVIKFHVFIMYTVNVPFNNLCRGLKWITWSEGSISLNVYTFSCTLYKLNDCNVFIWHFVCLIFLPLGFSVWRFAGARKSYTQVWTQLVSAHKSSTMYNFCKSKYKFTVIKKHLTNIKIWNLYRLCIQYVYLPLIKKDLKEIMEQWNNHLIRRQKLGDTVQGIPDVLFKNPEIVGKNLLRNIA